MLLAAGLMLLAAALLFLSVALVLLLFDGRACAKRISCFWSWLLVVMALLASSPFSDQILVGWQSSFPARFPDAKRGSTSDTLQ